jgi:hypothetical protein
MSRAFLRSPGSFAIELFTILLFYCVDSFDIESGKGILVAQVSKDSPEERSGLRPGDVIVESGAGDKRLLLLVRKGGVQRYVALRW